jgi:small-conductance mechanosensitive channel
VGDILQFDEGYYEVERIGFRSTNVRNIFRNYVVNYPNRVLEKNKIINEFQPDRRYFLFRFMTLDYETDVFKSLDIIRQTAYDHASVIKNDKRHSDPSARIKEFTELGVRVYLWCYIYDWWDQWLANDEILQEILRRFKKEGIKLAYPSRILQFDNRSPLRVSEENFEGIRGMNFEGIHDSSQEVAELSRSNMGMAGMKETVERNQAELRKKGTHVEKKK